MAESSGPRTGQPCGPQTPTTGSCLSPMAKGVLEKGSALAILRPSMTQVDFLEQWQRSVLPGLFRLSMVEGATVLSKWKTDRVITETELRDYTQLLLSSPAAGDSTPPTMPSLATTARHYQTPQLPLLPSSPYEDSELLPPSSGKDTPGAKTSGAKTSGAKAFEQRPLLDLVPLLKKGIPEEAEAFLKDTVKAAQECLGIHTVRDLVDFFGDPYKQQTILPSLTDPHHQEVLRKISSVLSSSRAHHPDGENIKQSEGDSAASDVVSFPVFHAESDRAELLVVLPTSSAAEGKGHYFAYVDHLSSYKPGMRSHQNNQESIGNTVIVVSVDISTSMNHDAKGEYQSPDSPDHPASSIRKARELIPPLVMASVASNISVVVQLWNHRLVKTIWFEPKDFLHPDTGELMNDTESLVKRKVSDIIFRADGATNTQVGLEAIMDQALAIVSRPADQETGREVSSVIVWFLTDGEQTYYTGPGGKCDPIPSNPQTPDYPRFHLSSGAPQTSGHLASYYTDLIRACVQKVDRIKAAGASLDFHVCHFGDADAIFLRELQEALQGHFHAFTDVQGIGEEMKSLGVAKNTSLTLHVGTRTWDIPGARMDNGWMCRGTFDPDVLTLLRARTEKPTTDPQDHFGFGLPDGPYVPLDHSRTTTISQASRRAAQHAFDLEPRIEAVLAACTKEISPQSLQEVSAQVSLIREERAKAVELFARHVPQGTTLQVFLEKILESVQVQIDAISRTIEQFLQKERLKLDKDALAKSDFFSEQQRQAISATLDSMRVRLGSSMVQAKLDKQVQKMVVEGAGRAKKMLERVCHLKEEKLTGAHQGRVRLSLRIMEGDADRKATQTIMSRPEIQQRLASAARPLTIHTVVDESSEEEEDSPNPELRLVRVYLLDKRDLLNSMMYYLQSRYPEYKEYIGYTQTVTWLENGDVMVLYHNVSRTGHVLPERGHIQALARWVSGQMVRLDVKPVRLQPVIPEPYTSLQTIVPAGKIFGFISGTHVVEFKHQTLYGQPVAEYNVLVQEKDLEEAKTWLMDPLSCADFTDLIREKTLPCYLYEIAPKQSPGLLFNSKELIEVVSGGQDQTNFTYFRMYWRLQHHQQQQDAAPPPGKVVQDNDILSSANCVMVPGTFTLANSALPIAPEPLTNSVLSNLMPGLVGEFITGTPMAPLTGVGDLYIGYLWMHMCQPQKHTGVDISRIADILATLGCWVNNPKTLPKPEEAQDLVRKLESYTGGSGQTFNSDSPGRQIPLKALAYSLLFDSNTHFHHRYNSLQYIIAQRSCKMLCSIEKAAPPKWMPAQLAEQRLPMKQWLRGVVQKLTDILSADKGQSETKQGEKEKEPAGDDGRTKTPDEKHKKIPEGMLLMGERLGHLVTAYQRGAAARRQESNEGTLDTIVNSMSKAFSANDNPSTPQTAIIEFLRQDPRVVRILFAAIAQVLGDQNDRILPMFRARDILPWTTRVQRALATFAVIGGYSTKEILDHFQQFQRPIAFEKHVERLVPVLTKDIPTMSTSTTGEQRPFVLSTMDANQKIYQIRSESSSGGGCDITKIQIHIMDPRTGVVEEMDELANDAVAMAVWDIFHAIASDWPKWGRTSTCQGLLDLDYDIVKALLDPKLESSLSASQRSDLSSIKSYIPVFWQPYSDFVPPPKVLPKLVGENVRITAQVRNGSEQKTHVNLVVLGHIDSGKSTTSGHLLFKTGIISEQVLGRLEQDSADLGKSTSKYAWVFDQLRAERERAISIEARSLCFETSRYYFTINDSPGHRDFIRNMIRATSRSDVGLLVISASAGEFEAGLSPNGQTREHALLAYTFGVKQIVVAVNKMDTVGYSAERFEKVVREASAFLKKVGYQPETTPFVPVSSWHGENLTETSDIPEMSWYKGFELIGKDNNGQLVTLRGFTLVDALDLMNEPARPSDMPLRISVDKAFALPGVGVVATGIVESGTLRQGQDLRICGGPIGTTKAKSVQKHHQPLEVASPGDLVGIQLAGIQNPQDVPRGAVICDPKKTPLEPVASFEVRLIYISPNHTLRKGTVPILCAHTVYCPVRVTDILQIVDRRTGESVETDPKKLQSVSSGQCAIVRFEPADCKTNTFGLCLEPFSVCPPLGRFCLRNNRAVVAVGIVTQVTRVAAVAPGTGSKGSLAASRLKKGKAQKRP